MWREFRPVCAQESEPPKMAAPSRDPPSRLPDRAAKGLRRFSKRVGRAPRASEFPPRRNRIAEPSLGRYKVRARGQPIRTGHRKRWASPNGQTK